MTAVAVADAAFNDLDDLLDEVRDFVAASKASATTKAYTTDWNHFDAFSANPLAHTNQFYALWRQIAAHYATAPNDVAFELLNEPKDAATTLALNPIYAEAIRQIRQTSPHRTIFVGPGKWNQASLPAAPFIGCISPAPTQ